MTSRSVDLRKPLIVAALAALSLGFAWWLGSGWALGTCGAIDRWTGASGCVARHFISDLRPLPFASMVAVDDHHVRLFGLADQGKDLVPTQLVVDLQTGKESGREDLPLKLSHYLIVPSQHSQQVAVICITNDACDAAHPKGYVLSAADGSVVEPIDQAEVFGWQFPEERPRTVFAGAWLDDNVSAEPDLKDGSIVLRDRDRKIVGQFAPAAVPGRQGAGPSEMAVKVSASGRFLAMIDSSRVGASRIDIYDVPTRQLLKSISTDRKVDTNGVWATDEKHLVLFQDWGAISAGQRGRGTELYVFEVR